jgi:hypothetical protein
MTPAEGTYALIVGISKFSFPNSDLQSPVRDALRFTDWLLRKKVPAKNIRLFLSPTDDARAKCDAEILRLSQTYGKLTYQPAESSLVDKYLDNTPEGETLLIYWSGHGVVNRADDRFLFYTDTTEATLQRHFDVRNTLKFLRSRRFPQQIAFFDTCAKLTPFDLGENKRVIPEGTARQSFLYAASPGQAATESKTTGVSAFSKQLFEVLEPQELPLDPDRLIDSVVRGFKKDPSQRPQYFVSKPPDGDEEIVGVRPASEYVQSVADQHQVSLQGLRHLAEKAAACPKLQQKAVRDQLFGDLQKAAQGRDLARPDYSMLDPGEDLLHIFAGAIDRQIVPRLIELLDALDAESLPAVLVLKMLPELKRVTLLTRDIPVHSAIRGFYRVANAGSGKIFEYDSVSRMVWKLSESGNLERVAEFLVHLAASEEEPLRTDLRNWAQPFLAGRFEHVEQAAEAVSAHLFIDIELEQTASGAEHKVVAFLRRGSRTLYSWPSQTCARAGLDRVIDAITFDAEKVVKEFFVQLLVPREMFGWTPHNIPVDGDPLGTYFPVALRWRERLHEMPRTRYKEWIERAEEIRRHVETGCKGCQWMDLTDGTPGLLGFLRPELETVRQRVKDGAPFAVWPVSDPADVECLRTDVDKIAGDCRPFDELPAVLRKKRYDRKAPDITLFWDDPKHLRAWRLLEP